MEQPPPDTTKPTTHYTGNCHCAAVRFTLVHPTLEGTSEEVTSCNCSICTRNGYLWIYPRKNDLVFIDGSDSKLKSYKFGKGEIAHMFCPNCGTSVCAMHPEHATMAVNVRTFKDIEVGTLNVTKFEGGKDLEPRYEA